MEVTLREFCRLRGKKYSSARTQGIATRLLLAGRARKVGPCVLVDSDEPWPCRPYRDSGARESSPGGDGAGLGD
jgi:hypothetical protein